MKKLLKPFAAILVALMLSGAFANGFTVRAAVADIQLPGVTATTPTAAVFGEVDYRVDITDWFGVTVGAAAGSESVAGLAGVVFSLPAPNQDADGDVFLAVRGGVYTDWSFSSVAPLATATLGLRGDNGLILEGGVLARFTDFGFGTYTLVPVIAVGFQF